MEQIINWFLTNWPILALIVENIIIVLGLIVKLTKSTEDDIWVAKLKEFWERIFPPKV